MNCFKISEKLEPITLTAFKNLGFQYVIVMNSEEWEKRNKDFDMGIEWELNNKNPINTNAIVNYDSITGHFHLPSRHNVSGKAHDFSFSLDEKGIIFVDDGSYALKTIHRIAENKKLVCPCLERFLYDFLEQLIYDDATMLSNYDKQLDDIESRIIAGNTDEVLKDIAVIRNDLRDIKIHYFDLSDLCQEFEENENDFFKENNERYFHLVSQRIQRLSERAATLVEFTIQLRDFCQTKVDERQNKSIAFLTVISTIFMPLTLIVGWYGMNFKYMPELGQKWGYPAVIAISVLIVLASVLFFKKKKWL